MSPADAAKALIVWAIAMVGVVILFALLALVIGYLLSKTLR